VISSAIQQYMYIVIHPYFHDKIRIKYSRTEDVDEVEAIRHPIVRECLRRVGIEKGVEIASFADISSGTGLGSSSSFTVGLLNALYAYRGKVIAKQRLAAEACDIEINVLREPIGKQDQFAAAYGNINHIRFNRDETVEVSPILLTEPAKRRLEKCLCLYYLGGQRKAGDILSEQKNNLAHSNNKSKYLESSIELVNELKTSLGSENVDTVGKMMHQGWSLKKNLSGNITNKEIDHIYDKALRFGATGGKLLGAGGAGFLLLFHEDHEFLSKKLGCKTLPFNIDREGTKIIFYE
ncbi:MAG: GHMP kinase, partial [Thermodesulfobacteriota bacterium]|nr:GHMP kinase [Thermodesulfobacteriota bacterium]